MITRPTEGTHNYLNEINKVLTVERFCSSVIEVKLGICCGFETYSYAFPQAWRVGIFQAQPGSNQRRQK